MLRVAIFLALELSIQFYRIITSKSPGGIRIETLDENCPANAIISDKTARNEKIS